MPQPTIPTFTTRPPADAARKADTAADGGALRSRAGITRLPCQTHSGLSEVLRLNRGRRPQHLKNHLESTRSAALQFLLPPNRSSTREFTMPHDILLKRIRAEYLEMPGLRLTLEQAQRLCGVERTLCKAVLDELV